jgi:purine-binding chemotaxis protein CheW
MVALPHAPPSVVGVAEYRGEVIPIVDLRARFGQPPAPPTRKTKWIVTSSPRRTLAFVVDAVTEVFGTGGRDLRPSPALGAGDDARGIAGVTNRDGLVFVLDSERIAELLGSLGVETGMSGPLSLPAHEGST